MNLIAELKITDNEDGQTVKVTGTVYDENGYQTAIDWDAPSYMVNVVLDQARKMGVMA